MVASPSEEEPDADREAQQPRDEATRETDRYFELVTEVREALRGRRGTAAAAVASTGRNRAEGGIG